MREFVPRHGFDDALDVVGVQMDLLASVLAVFREGVDDEAVQVRMLAPVAQAQQLALERKAVFQRLLSGFSWSVSRYFSPVRYISSPMMLLLSLLTSLRGANRRSAKPSGHWKETANTVSGAGRPLTGWRDWRRSPVDGDVDERSARMGVDYWN